MMRYDDDAKTVSKFQFRTEPREFGPKLDADVALLHDLALRGLHVFPWVCMLPFLGEAAHDLFLPGWKRGMTVCGCRPSATGVTRSSNGGSPASGA